jgi:spore germination protein
MPVMRPLAAALAATATFAALAADADAREREVMGFLPYWELGAELRWDVLDIVAYFDVGVRPDGSLGDSNGWPDDPAVADLIARAAQEGKRAVLTVTNFNPDEISSLVQGAAARQQFIDAIVPLVLGAGGHGINIDLEGVRAEDREAFTLFVTEVAAAFHNADPAAHVSVSAPAVDWSGAFDTAGLLAAADALFIMGYDYHWRGGNPGPVAELSSGTLWPARLNLGRTIADYTAPLAHADRRRLILGLPLYGRDWPADSDEAPAQRPRDGDGNLIGDARSVFYRDWSQGVGDLLWDIESATPWYVYREGDAWRQVWAEDVVSIAAKLDLAVEHDLSLGFWALGYDDADPALWEVVAERAAAVSPLPPPDSGPEPDPEPGPGPDAGPGSPDANPGAGAAMGGGCSAGGSGSSGAIALLVAALVGRRRRCDSVTGPRAPARAPTWTSSSAASDAAAALGRGDAGAKSSTCEKKRLPVSRPLLPFPATIPPSSTPPTNQ